MSASKQSEPASQPVQVIQPDDEVLQPSSGRPAWLMIREKVVEQALEDGDVEALRRISALPGGFGSNDMRRRVWPVLLNVKQFFPPSGPSRQHGEREPHIHQQEASHSPEEEGSGMGKNGEGGPADIGTQDGQPHLDIHPDEGQVTLDTKRAFVSYPKDLPCGSKQALQADLQHLIVSILRKYPTLSYFQGFHDIMSVLYLTFIPPYAATPHSPSKSRSRNTSLSQKRTGSQGGEKSADPDLEHDKEGRQKARSWDEKDPPAPPLESLTPRDTPDWETLRHCAEIVSLCRVRDAMGKGLEGMMGMLRILERILKAADPELARFSSNISPVPTLPFFALSWILCLFSHDVDTLEPIQRMFDFLLARNPISAIYLGVAILVAKKPQMLKLAKLAGSEVQDDPTLLHPLFSRLPPLHSDTPDHPHPDGGARPASAIDLKHLDDECNPYEPIPLSDLFSLTDTLMSKFPWDGETIRGDDIMGAGSVVYSYARETLKAWSSSDVLELLGEELVKPGGGMEDVEDEVPSLKPVHRRATRRLRPPRDRIGTSLAVGVVVLGIGIAFYGAKAGGLRGDWSRWWAVVLHKYLAKGQGMRLVEYARGWRMMLGFVARSMRDLL